MADVKYGLQCERHLFVYVDYVYLECCGRNIVFGIAFENVGLIYLGWWIVVPSLNEFYDKVLLLLRNTSRMAWFKKCGWLREKSEWWSWKMETWNERYLLSECGECVIVWIFVASSCNAVWLWRGKIYTNVCVNEQWNLVLIFSWLKRRIGFLIEVCLFECVEGYVVIAVQMQ